AVRGGARPDDPRRVCFAARRRGGHRLRAGTRGVRPRARRRQRMNERVPTLAVSAPGKAFLIGEYAVLEGVPALVTAIDVRAIAHAPADAPPAVSAVVSCAHARVADYLRGRGVEAIDVAPVVETGGFTMGQRKLGLGSSAAVTAAVIGYHLVNAGL